MSPSDDDQLAAEVDQYRLGLPTVTYVEQVLIPRWLRLFRGKSLDYGENHRTLGERGQFAEVWRKVFKLKRAMWDGIPLQNESLEEVVLDMIGHLFLTLELLDRPGGPVVTGGIDYGCKCPEGCGGHAKVA